MLNIFFRTIIIYVVVVVAMRFMGKRQIGEFEPSEFVIAIMISEVAAIPLGNVATPLLQGIIPVLTLIIAEICLSFICIKSGRARNIFIGKPSIIIEKGIINQNELKKVRFDLEDVIEELRCNGYCNISDIEYAILETSGQLSIIPKPAYAPATKQDVKAPLNPSSVPFILAKDGCIIYSELSRSNHDVNWFHSQMKKFNISKVEDVFFASLDSAGTLTMQKKQANKKSRGDFNA
jgi:Predicted membrane protein